MIEELNKDQPQKEEASTPPGVALSERRDFPRYPFTGTAEAVEPRTGTRITGRVGDLCLGGCYIDTTSLFAVDAVVRLRITKDQKTFQALAKVVNSQPGMGMGVKFTSVEPGQLRILENWIGVLSGAIPAVDETLQLEEQVFGESGRKEEHNLVLNELIVVLMRKRVLTGEEGLKLLKNLHG
jgi:PilZ domain-containing protein